MAKRRKRITIEFEGIRKEQKMTVIFISMSFCGSCRKLQNAMEYAGIEVDEHREIDTNKKDDMDFAQKYNIQTFPTLLKLDNNGNELGRLCGLQALSNIREFLEN